MKTKRDKAIEKLVSLGLQWTQPRIIDEITHFDPVRLETAHGKVETFADRNERKAIISAAMKAGIRFKECERGKMIGDEDSWIITLSL